VLNETEYSNSLAGITRGEEYEKVLSNELKRVYELMREITKDQVVVDILALKYDYHNLKVMIKEKEINKELSDLYVPLGTTDYKEIKSEFAHGNLKEIKPEFKDAIEAVL